MLTQIKQTKTSRRAMKIKMPAGKLSELKKYTVKNGEMSGNEMSGKK